MNSPHTPELEDIRRQLEVLQARNAALSEELEALAFFASHDFQEPLVIQTMFIRILKHELEHTLSEEARLAVDAISTSGERMHQLVLAMLAYSRAGRKVLHPEPTDLGSLVSKAIASFAARIEQTGAKVESAFLGEALVDADATAQVVSQLLDNALKFHQPGAHPRVLISCEMKAGWKVLCVHDNGIGIEPEEAPRIFRPFTRLNQKDAYAGAGVGLAICRTLVQRQGGDIWVNSQPGDGSTFCFSMQQVS